MPGKLVISYVDLEKAADAMDAIVAEYEGARQTEHVRPEGGVGSPTLTYTAVDVTDFLPQHLFRDMGNDGLMSALNHFQSRWRDPLSSALTGMSKTAAYFHSIADAFADADMTVAAGIRTPGAGGAATAAEWEAYRKSYQEYLAHKDEVDENGDKKYSEPMPPGYQAGDTVVRDKEGRIVGYKSQETDAQGNPESSMTMKYGADGVPVSYEMHEVDGDRRTMTTATWDASTNTMSSATMLHNTTSGETEIFNTNIQYQQTPQGNVPATMTQTHTGLNQDQVTERTTFDTQGRPTQYVQETKNLEGETSTNTVNTSYAADGSVSQSQRVSTSATGETTTETTTFTSPTHFETETKDSKGNVTSTTVSNVTEGTTSGNHTIVSETKGADGKTTTSTTVVKVEDAPDYNFTAFQPGENENHMQIVTTTTTDGDGKTTESKSYRLKPETKP